MTRVENVLTLLSAKHLGTPHLSFSLAPRPLQLLSIDPSDPNLWFNQLLARRSSGIEGIQEFTAVLVVPRGEDFCVDARLRRVCLLDSPPGRSRSRRSWLEPNLDLLQLMQDDRVPLPGLPDRHAARGARRRPDRRPDPASEFRRPVVETWAFRLLPLVVEAIVASPHSTPGNVKRGSVNYKHFLELWLETLHDEYEQEAGRSPLERGVLLGENRHLGTCFSNNQAGKVAVTSSDSSVSPLVRVPIDLGDIDVGGVEGLRLHATCARGPSRPSRAGTRSSTRSPVCSSSAASSEGSRRRRRPGRGSVLLDRWSKLRRATRATSGSTRPPTS